jgi:hypothetical protein
LVFIDKGFESGVGAIVLGKRRSRRKIIIDFAQDDKNGQIPIQL